MNKGRWNILISNDHDGFSVDEEILSSLFIVMLEALRDELPSDSINEVSIAFMDDPSIHKLNLEYRGKDKATDVLSFSQIEGEDALESTTLGDIVVSLDTAKRQAHEYEHSLNDECARLLAHGLLHLFGYDHVGVSDAERKRMKRREEDLLGLISGESFVSPK